MTDALTILSHEIRELLEEPVSSERTRFLARLEHTLTEGYARALGLEAECVRLERSIGKLAAGLDGGADAKRAEELVDLSRRLARVEGELSRLRALLEPLRERAREVRVAS